uniref:Calmodulin-lysine N-methyltransferase n=1 Tax=Odontella aurita TaxID=265563 RepID=A0A7S4N8Y2_9STRA|mmetsp:Transcript_52884/g.158294  ORF Transcript_52884/g.158294 Transcript_52884/m.158294 type:complete len:370 (+) Transcript_52884:220-1329(+)
MASTCEYDELALWDLYERDRGGGGDGGSDVGDSRGGGDIVRLSDRVATAFTIRDAAVGRKAHLEDEEDDRVIRRSSLDENAEYVKRTVNIDPGLSVSLRLPLHLLEDGCVCEVGALVWDCAVSFARYLTAADTCSCAPATPDITVDLGCYDHIVEVGSGMGTLGLAVHRFLTSPHRGRGAMCADRKTIPRITLTDFVPDLLESLRLSAFDATAGKASSSANHSHSAGGAHNAPGMVALSVESLDWSSDFSAQWIRPGESVLVIGSEVIYEPAHAAMLSECIGRLLNRSCRWTDSRVIIANNPDRPGWINFVRLMEKVVTRLEEIDTEGSSVEAIASMRSLVGDGRLMGGTQKEAPDDAMVLDLRFRDRT